MCTSTPGWPDPLVRVAAALVLHPPGAFASHVSAARVYGLPLPVHPLEHVSVVRAGDRRRRAGIRNHLAPPGTPVVAARGLRVSAPDGRVLMRFDLSYPDLRIVIEYDGRQHRADLDQWDRDEQRKDWFDHRGWRRVPVLSRGIYVQPAATVARVVRALAARGVRVRPTDGWRPHFPGRG